MADEDDTEKTEDPSQKRLEEALERGDVVKSQEVNTWFILGAGTLVLMGFSGGMGSGFATMMRGLIANSHAQPVDGFGLQMLAQKITLESLALIGVPFLLLALGALVGNIIQHRLVFSSEGLAPKLQRVSPMAGFKRLFSKQALANFVKGLIKLALIGTVVVMLLWPERLRLEALTATDPAYVMPFSKSLSLTLLGTVVAILALIAAADYLFQHRQWFEKQKMSLRELKEEYKQSEGDPAVKGKIRQLRVSRARQRMMAAVPQASVVITNPTHFAVALKFEPGMNAPVCLAKGVDALAFRIREKAKEHGIPVVENPPLARALHATVDIDQEIPAEHYKAVAEIIGFVMKLRRRRH